jgi:hypothetical protein
VRLATISDKYGVKNRIFWNKKNKNKIKKQN